MAAALFLEEELRIPLNLGSLADFRHWAGSDAFPDRGRIDYIAGRIEVDMSPEDFFCHGVLNTEILRVLAQHVKETDLGHLVTDRTRVSCPAADLSVEPDVVFVSHQALAAGRVRLVPKTASEEGRYVELEGAPDLIVEIVSDRSVFKDTRRLPAAYFKAGVREFWLADARGDRLRFQIYARGKAGFKAARPNAAGFQPSTVLGSRFRLDGRRDARRHWKFDLRME